MFNGPKPPGSSCVEQIVCRYGIRYLDIGKECR